MIVVDASALLETLLRTPASPPIDRRISGARGALHAPHLIDLEIAQVLRRYVTNQDLGAEHGRAILANLVDFPIKRHPHERLIPRIWELRHNLTAYDAAYVALAETLDATLITRGQRLAAAPGHRARIEVV